MIRLLRDRCAPVAELRFPMDKLVAHIQGRHQICLGGHGRAGGGCRALGYRRAAAARDHDAARCHRCLPVTHTASSMARNPSAERLSCLALGSAQIGPGGGAWDLALRRQFPSPSRPGAAAPTRWWGPARRAATMPARCAGTAPDGRRPERASAQETDMPTQCEVAAKTAAAIPVSGCERYQSLLVFPCTLAGIAAGWSKPASLGTRRGAPRQRVGRSPRPG
jgi:hypothetical protein